MGHSTPLHSTRRTLSRRLVPELPDSLTLHLHLISTERSLLERHKIRSAINLNQWTSLHSDNTALAGIFKIYSTTQHQPLTRARSHAQQSVCCYQTHTELFAEASRSASRSSPRSDTLSLHNDRRPPDLQSLATSAFGHR